MATVANAQRYQMQCEYQQETAERVVTVMDIFSHLLDLVLSENFLKE